MPLSWDTHTWSDVRIHMANRHGMQLGCGRLHSNWAQSAVVGNELCIHVYESLERHAVNRTQRRYMSVQPACSK